MSPLLLWAIPFFVVTLVAEALWARRARTLRPYELKDTATSLSLGIVHLGVAALAGGAVLVLWGWVHDHRLFDLRADAWWSWVLLLFLEDLTYYVWHRTSHEVRFFWASHVNHHSSTAYNLSTALRQSVTDPLTGHVFWLPLVLLGFHPLMVVTQQAVSLLYQYLLHTEAVGRLPGVIEAVFNTPSHHRVHHGSNAAYLDRNHAGIFIIWDRLFGTFVPEREPVVYGLTKDLGTFNFLTVAFHEWAAIGRDVKRAKSVREVLGAVFGPPGWQADGRGETSAVLRARVPR